MASDRYAKLQKLYLDRELFDAVKNYFAEYVEAEALRNLFSFQPVIGYAEARQIIEAAFDQIEATFAKKPEPKKGVDNQSR